jgi:hypothetical protein
MSTKHSSQFPESTQDEVSPTDESAAIVMDVFNQTGQHLTSTAQAGKP